MLGALAFDRSKFSMGFENKIRSFEVHGSGYTFDTEVNWRG